MADFLPFHPYDLLLALAGATLLLITLGRRLLERLNINSTYLYLLTGVPCCSWSGHWCRGARSGRCDGRCSPSP